MSQNNEQPLSAQQIQSVHKQAEASIRGILGDIEIRKLALRHACDVVMSTTATPREGKLEFYDPIKLAEGMHAFLTKGARDTKGPNQV